MSEPIIACYVAQSGDSRGSCEIFVPGTLSALEYIPPEECHAYLDEELVPLEDQLAGALVTVKTSGDFRKHPYFPVYATRHGIRRTREMVREKLGDSKTPLDVFQAKAVLFKTLAKNKDCVVGKVISPEE